MTCARVLIGQILMCLDLIGLERHLAGANLKAHEESATAFKILRDAIKNRLRSYGIKIAHSYLNNY